MEWDEEIYQISSTHPTWKAYCEWLKLVVIYLDAVHILPTHMQKSQNPEVTIEVIIAPRPDRSLLAWKDLLNDKGHFDDMMAFGDHSPKEIITFLERWQNEQSTAGPSVNDVMILFKKICDNNSNSSTGLDEIIEGMKNMGRCQSPGYSDVVEGLIASGITQVVRACGRQIKVYYPGSDYEGS
jgi:hypothetical protein